jgi:hypothetical protein
MVSAGSGAARRNILRRSSIICEAEEEVVAARAMAVNVAGVWF